MPGEVYPCTADVVHLAPMLSPPWSSAQTLAHPSVSSFDECATFPRGGSDVCAGRSVRFARCVVVSGIRSVGRVVGEHIVDLKVEKGWWFGFTGAVS